MGVRRRVRCALLDAVYLVVPWAGHTALSKNARLGFIGQTNLTSAQGVKVGVEHYG